MGTLRERLFSSHPHDESSTSTSFWKGRILKYVGLFLLLGTPLTLIALQGANSDQGSKASNDNVSVKQQGTEVQPMKPDQQQNQSGNSSSSHVRVETNLHSSTSSGSSNDQQNASGSNATNQSSTSTSVNINGRDVSLPPDGELHKTFTSPDGSVSSVDISVNGDGGNSSSSVQVQVDGSGGD